MVRPEADVWRRASCYNQALRCLSFFRGVLGRGGSSPSDRQGCILRCLFLLILSVCFRPWHQIIQQSMSHDGTESALDPLGSRSVENAGTDDTDTSIKEEFCRPVAVVFSKVSQKTLIVYRSPYFFLNNAAFTTPFGSFTSRITSQMIRPRATTDRPR